MKLQTLYGRCAILRCILKRKKLLLSWILLSPATAIKIRWNIQEQGFLNLERCIVGRKFQLHWLSNRNNKFLWYYFIALSLRASDDSTARDSSLAGHRRCRTQETFPNIEQSQNHDKLQISTAQKKKPNVQIHHERERERQTSRFVLCLFALQLSARTVKCI